MILFLSMSIVTQCIKQSKYTILRGNEKNVRRGKEGVRLPLCLFFSQNIKLHTHTTCPLHHTILTLFQGRGGGGGVGEVGNLTHTVT